jgi:hypothetical protein
MKTLKESLLTESTIESIEDVAKLLKPYVKQWYKSIPVNNEYSDDLVPVKNIVDGIIKYGSSYNEGIWKSLNFELKSGYTGRICQQLSDGMRSKVSFINGFYIYIDHDLAPFEGFRFRYTTSEGLKDAIKFIKNIK